VEVSLSHNPSRTLRTPLSSLGKLTVGLLAGVTALLIAAQALLFGGFDMIVSVIALVPLIAAAVMLIGWRWAPLLGTLVFALLLALLALGSGEIAYTLAHPGGAMFSLFIAAIAVVLGGLAASISTAVQNYRGASRSMPRALPATVALVAGLVIGAGAVGAIPQAGESAGISPETLAALPAVTLENFDSGEIHVNAGEAVALRLENPDGVAHAFVIDELGVAAPMPAGKNSLALFKPATPGRYTFYCTPHYNKASGEGMHGTLIVE
jgi:plastocyanin